MRVNTPGLMAAFVMLSLVTFTACKSRTTASSPNARVAAPKPASKEDDLQAAMDKLEESIHKPAESFHASFKKSGSDGFSYECQAEISSSGITGQQIDNNPATKFGTDVFPANTRTRQLNGTPYGSPAWQTVYGGISMAYLNGHIGDAQPGVKYFGDEQSGGYDARRYDFDLTGVDANIKKAMEMGNSLGMRQTRDYNVKGSAWIAKNDGRMVKFSFDNIYTFNDGKIESTHYEGIITKE
ncbi:MAG TPA: hypothetical protein VL156_04145 [Terriglobales bacterium]|jgi:hypothetical protein|nr:hypothetical protein [Terriglobales bacterium]